MTHAVDLAELDSMIAQMARFEAVSREHLAELDARMNELHSVWQGEASQAHRAAHRELMKGVADMHAGLRAMREAARTAHGNYSRAARTNADMLSGLG